MPSDAVQPGEGASPTQVNSPSAVDGAVFRSVRSGNPFEETLERLLQAVRLGVIPPGESLPPERDLAVRLGVSRDTVREAIRSLIEAGYLESRRGRYGGSFVRADPPAGWMPLGRSGADAGPAIPITQAEIDDVLSLRELLEVGAVRAAAAQTLTAAQRELLWARLEETAAAAAADYRRCDSRLHLTFGELTGTPSLIPLLVDSRSRVNALLDEIPLLPRNIAHSNQQHAAIVGAVLRADPGAAGDAMAEHLAGTAALLRAFLR